MQKNLILTKSSILTDAEIFVPDCKTTPVPILADFEIIEFGEIRLVNLNSIELYSIDILINGVSGVIFTGTSVFFFINYWVLLSLNILIMYFFPL